MRAFLRLFSFYGRSKRSSYWIYVLVSIVSFIVLSLAFDLLLFRFDWFHILEKVKESSPTTVPLLEKLNQVPAALCIAVGIFGALLLLALTVSWFSISIRRLHDMGATGWLVLVFALLNAIGLVSGIGLPISFLITTLVLGTWPSSRHNRYGSGMRDDRDLVGVFDDRRPAGTA